MPEKQSYLTEVKEKFISKIDELIDAEADPDTVKKELWLIFEARCKESFTNGRKASGNGRATTERRAAFRR